MNLSDTLKDPLNWVASIAMMANGGFGVFCNSMIVYIFFKNKSERTSFNLICAYRAIVNLFILIVTFMLTFVPITLFGDNLYPGVYQYIVITSANSMYVSLQYCEVLIGVNRFCAMYIPLLYAKFFNVVVTFIVVMIIFVYRATKIFREASSAIPKSCYALFSAQDLLWKPDFRMECRGDRVDSNSVISGTAIYLIVLLVINALTFTKIWLFYKSTESNDGDVKRKMKKNRVLFFQTICQDATFMVDMLFTFKLSNLIDSRYWTFISGSFVWESVHSFDGFIMMLFNERLTFLKKSLFASTVENTMVKSSIPMRNTMFLRDAPTN